MERKTHKGNSFNLWIVIVISICNGVKMAKKIKFRIDLVISFLLFVIVFGAVGFYFSRNGSSTENSVAIPNNSSVIYLVYSPACPHCHHLMDYLSTITTNVTIIETTDARRIYSCLKKENIDWDFGVPIMVAKINNAMYMVSGYPSVDQDMNGYFMGKDKEEQICNSGGKPIYVNGSYAFCEIGNNKYLGNKYSVDYLISLCEKYGCEAFC